MSWLSNEPEGEPVVGDDGIARFEDGTIAPFDSDPDALNDLFDESDCIHDQI